MASAVSNKDEPLSLTQGDLKPGQGAKEDFSVFIHHFTEKNTLRYEDFSELWKELAMPYLFAGRKDYELREAAEYAYSCAVDLFNEGLNIQTKICAVYLLYAVYQTQGLFPKSRIRVTVTQFRTFVTFVEEMSSKQHYDFVFIFTRLRMERAFLYVATAQVQGKTKKSRINTSRLVKEDLPTGLVSTFSDLSLDLVEDLAVVNEEYYRVKCATTNPGCSSTVPHPSVDLAKPDFIKDITRQLAKFDNWRKTGNWKKKAARKRTVSGATTSGSEGDNASDSDSAAEHPEESIATKRQIIREKAFATVAETQRSTRYRKVATESSQPADPPTSSKRTKPTHTKTSTTRRALTSQEEDDMAVTNAHLMMATAPSKKMQRIRRKAMRAAGKDRMMSPGRSDDSD